MTPTELINEAAWIIVAFLTFAVLLREVRMLQRRYLLWRFNRTFKRVGFRVTERQIYGDELRHLWRIWMDGP